MGILSEKLKALGFDGKSTEYILSFLENRKQRVINGTKISDAKETESGSPEGSRMSALIFSIAMIDLDLWVKEASLINYSDDVFIYSSNTNFDKQWNLLKKKQPTFSLSLMQTRLQFKQKRQT